MKPPTRSLAADGADPRSCPGTRRTRRFGLLLVALALPATGGCAANFGAQTNVQFQSGVGSDNRDGAIYALNVLAVADDEGNGTVVATLINQRDDTDYVTDFTAVDSAGDTLTTSVIPADQGSTAADSGIELASQDAVKLPDDALLQVSGDAVQPGGFITIRLTFKNAAPLEIGVPVVTDSEIYNGVTVGPIDKHGSKS